MRSEMMLSVLKEEVPASTPTMTFGGAVSPLTIGHTASADQHGRLTSVGHKRQRQF